MEITKYISQKLLDKNGNILNAVRPRHVVYYAKIKKVPSCTIFDIKTHFKRLIKNIYIKNYSIKNGKIVMQLDQDTWFIMQK